MFEDILGKKEERPVKIHGQKRAKPMDEPTLELTDSDLDLDDCDPNGDDCDKCQGGCTPPRPQRDPNDVWTTKGA